MKFQRVMNGVLSPNLTYLQKQQIQIGKTNGLTHAQLMKVNKPWLNYLQMEQIRLGLENGLAYSQIRQYADCRNTPEQMRIYRIALESNERIQRRISPLAAATGIVSGLAAAAFLLYAFFFKPFTGSIQDNMLVLELSETSVQLECGEVFEPSQYVKTSSDHSAQLIYPDAIDTSIPGSHTAVYRLVNDIQETVRTMRVKVVDKTEPDLQLIKDQIVYSDFDKPFDCRAYIAYANDTVDGNLTKEVSCSSQLHETGLQEVLYRVSDYSGNTAVKTLMVDVDGQAQGKNDTDVQSTGNGPTADIPYEQPDNGANIQEEIVIAGEWIYEEVGSNETEVTHDIQ